MPKSSNADWQNRNLLGQQKKSELLKSEVEAMDFLSGDEIAETSWTAVAFAKTKKRI